MPSGALVYDPSQLAGLSSGANMSGSPAPVPPNNMVAPGTASIGGASSPLIPGSTTGTNMPAYSSPYTPSGATAALAGTNTMTNYGGAQTSLFGAPQSTAMQDDIAKGFQASGYQKGVGTALSEFLMSGAGFNPAVADSLIAAMQPQIAKGQANLMEQFGSHGLAMGSPAALGLGDYMAQTNLDVGTLLSGLYEQSVSNYMNVLLAGKGGPQQTGFLGKVGGVLGNLIGGAAGNLDTTGSSSTGEQAQNLGIGALTGL